MSKTSVERFAVGSGTQSGAESSGWNGPLSIGMTTFERLNSVTYSPETVYDYKAKIRNRASATTTMDAVLNRMYVSNSDRAMTKHRHVSVPSFTTWSWNGGCFSFNGQFATDPSSLIIESVRNQAKTRVISKIRSAQTSLKGLVTVGEFGETVRMVNFAGKGLMSGMRSFLFDVQQNAGHWARRATPQNLARRIGQRWLEYSFGWKPLVADIDDGMRAIQRWQSRSLPSVQVRVGAESGINEILPFFNVSKSWYTISYQPRRRLRYGYKIYGSVGLTNPGLGSLAHEYGFKLDEFVPTLWELIPFSFLADYFVNIGVVIDALAFNSSAVQWLNYGELRECELSHDLRSHVLQSPASYKAYEDVIYLGPPFRHLRQRKLRGVQSLGHLTPTLEFRVPGTSTKWLNIAALAEHAAETSLKVRSFRL